VVDDGSDDDSRTAIAQRFPNVCQIRTSGAVGYAGALNLGVASTTGNLIWLLNSDTEVDPDGIERLLAHFNDSTGLGIGGAALRYPDGTPQWSGGRFPTPLWLFLQASGLPALLGRRRLWRAIRPVSGTDGQEVHWVAGAALAVRREVWNRVGPFSHSYQQYCQDLDLCWQTRVHGWDVRVLSDVGVVHHLGATISLDKRSIGDTHTGLLWSDLVRFYSKNHGRRAGARAERLIRLGGWTRIAARRAVTPIVSHPDRARWRSDTELYLGALRGVSARGSTARDQP
jgi:GT2 family glycosyltransferase